MSIRCPISVLIPTKNEGRNLGRCLEPLVGWADEIVVVDSQSTDSTLEIAAEHGTTILQFHYTGGWPKKRQWALNRHDWKNDWILLLDADEILLPEIRSEIAAAIQDEQYNGYWIRFQIFFLGRMLRYGGNSLWKLSLLRRGMGRYEMRLKQQDLSMADMEVHEHVIVDGRVGRLQEPVRHENFNSLDRYIAKHNEYSNWEARLLMAGGDGQVTPALFGNQARRRRFLKRKLLSIPGSPLMFFVMKYVVSLGILDGVPGLVYCALQAVQVFHVKAKLYEMRHTVKTQLTSGSA